MQPDEQKLQELVQRIVEAARPIKIILFGSAARGEMEANSDLDVLVIVPNGIHRKENGRIDLFSFIGVWFCKGYFRCHLR